MHHHQTVSVDNGILHIVGNHNGGKVILAYNLIGSLQHLCRRLGIQCGGMLIQQQKLRFP